MNRILLLISTALLVFSCSRPSDPNRLQAISEQGSLMLSWGGQPRLQGGAPGLEGVDLGPLLIEDEAAPDGTYTYAGDGQNPVQVRVRTTANSDVLALYLSPNGRQSVRGEHYVGFFFDNLPGFSVGTSFYRYGPVKAWTVPVQVTNPGQMHEDDIQFFLWQYADSVYAAAMPLGGQGYNATLGTANGRFGVKSVALVDGVQAQDIPLMAIGFGHDPYALIDSLYRTGMELMGRPENLRERKTFPEPLAYVGWCTWNGLGHNLTQQKILDGVASFTQNDFPLPLLIIDDGWLTVGPPPGRLQAFEPDKTKFPQGLKAVVEQLKSQHGVKHVGVWHTLNGYWGGVDPASTLGERYGEQLMPYQDKVTWIDRPIETFYAPTVKSNKGVAFFDDWYRYLKGEGISLVKVDNQLVVDRMARGNAPLWEAGAHAEGNLQKAVAQHFGGAVINCMDMTTNAIYHFGTSAVGRNSEDYFPTETSYTMEKGNAAVHVLANNYNSLWFSPMVWPDFDMFQSHHPDAEYHAIARAISGGPVYLTDSPGQQNFDLLRKLVYHDGRVIRSDVPARPTRDCLFQVQDPKPFKAFSRSGAAGLLGIWNAADADSVSGVFRPSDVYGLEGERFAVYDHLTRQVHLAQADQPLPVRLPRMGYKLYLVVPLEQEVALFGLVDKYNSPKTIINSQVSAKEVLVELPEGGVFGAYINKSPKTVEVDGRGAEHSYEAGLLLVQVPDSSAAGARKVRIEFP